jgi:hypothetical protein
MTVLSMWTVYNSPSDYPGKVVARRFDITDGDVAASDSIIVMDDLDVLRRALAIDMRLTCLSRSPGDDPVIVETWL